MDPKSPAFHLPIRAGRTLFILGVSDGTRTRDFQDHNLVLYQLNYTHHRRRPNDPGERDISRSWPLKPNPYPRTRSLPR